jgi:hypothetical protein
MNRNHATQSNVPKKKKPKLFTQKHQVFLCDSSDSDSSVGSFFLKKRNSSSCTSVKRSPPVQEVSTPDMTVVHNRSSARREEAYDYGRADTTETSRMMDVTRLKKSWTKVIDLTGTSDEPELPGPLFSEMKEQNNVFWVYDPRGVPISKLDTAYYCPQCKCPFHYCAVITFGDVVTTQVEFLLVNQLDPKMLTYDWLEKQFRAVYWSCVHHKMMMNSIPFPRDYNFPSNGILPACIEKSHLKKLFIKYGAKCDKNRGKSGKKIGKK